MADEIITIESITSTVETPDKLSPEQKTYLTDHAAELDDEVATKYGVTKPAPKIEPEVRGGDEDPEKDKGKKKAGEEDDETDPADEEKINKMIEKRVAPLQQQLTQRTNEAEVDSFLNNGNIQTKYPGAGKFREAMIKYMNHPAYAKIPAANVFRIVAGDDLMKMGAAAEREAQTKTKGSQVRASSARVPAGQKDWGSATKEEFEAKRAEVFGRPN
jgi:hypothetical protein